MFIYLYAIPVTKPLTVSEDGPEPTVTVVLLTVIVTAVPVAMVLKPKAWSTELKWPLTENVSLADIVPVKKIIFLPLLGSC